MDLRLNQTMSLLYKSNIDAGALILQSINIKVLLKQIPCAWDAKEPEKNITILHHEDRVVIVVVGPKTWNQLAF